MKFSKEYIKECDCKEIQELRPKFKKGDWYYDAPTKLTDNISWDCDKLKSTVWLPTGDQLDLEIVKIIDNIPDEIAPNPDLDIHYMPKSKTWYCGYHYDLCCEELEDYKRAKLIEFWDINLDIAKIKLLKVLLKG